ncbi:MAG: potassium-transporting ATPase subunit KdpC [Hyphomicrobium sp.]
MLTHLRPAIVMLAFFMVLTGLAYPFAITGLAQAVLSDKANGSLVTRGDAVVGTALIGQSFGSDAYFHGRPSAAGANGYDAAASSGSNFGPLSKKLQDRVAADVSKLRGDGAALIPADAVTTSASGLDPHISPEFAAIQINRVAKARGVSPEQVKDIVMQASEHPALGFIGEPRVNVLKLNLALDAALPKATG